MIKAAPILVLVTGLMGLGPAVAPAATITPTVLTDDITDNGNCTLREAVQASNTNAAVDLCTAGSTSAPDTIVLTVGGASAYLLSVSGTSETANQSGDLDVHPTATSPLTIESSTTESEIDGSSMTNTDRVIEAPFGETTSLTLNRIRLDDGQSFAGESGGALRSTGSKTVTLNDSRVTNSDTDSRGAGMLVTGDLTLNNSTVSGNESTDTGGNVGGGIVSNGDVIIDRSTITLNAVTSPDDANIDDTFGGGIAASIGSLTITDSTISNNTVNTADPSDNAGGVGIYAEDIPVTIRRSMISSNIVLGVPFGRLGGGIFFNDTDPADPTLSIENSTLEGNLGGSSGFIFGGGALIHGGVSEVAYSTFTANNAGQGDAVNYDDFADTGSSATFLGSIFDDGTGIDECAGPDPVGSAGFNLDKGTTCGFGATGDQSSTDADVSDVGDNGGPTETGALLGTSPALDVIPPASCVGIDAAPLATDQRGFERPFGAGCDAGAYERILCDGVAVNETDLVGTSGPDTIIGTAGDDDIVGFGGDDVIEGLGGGDDLCGGDGNDLLVGGADGDSLEGGGGNDTASFAGGGAVTASLTAASGQGSDQLDSVENLSGSAFGDQLTGDGLPNLLNGGDGNDTLNGGGADDTLEGESGNDALKGDAGNDNLKGEAGGDAVEGGPGNDTGLGGTGDDNLKGDAGSDTLQGAEGNDAGAGGTGNDSLAGGEGDDSASGGAGNDSLLGGAGNDILLGETENDNLRGGAGNDLARGGPGVDLLFGDSGLDRLFGNSGKDRLNGGAGKPDRCNGGAGKDRRKAKGCERKKKIP